MSKLPFSRKRKGKKVEPYPLGPKQKGKVSQTKRTRRGRPKKAKAQFTVWFPPELSESEVRAILDSDPRIETYDYYWDRLGPERLVWHVQVTVRGGEETVDKFIKDHGLDKEIQVKPRAKRGRDGELYLEQVDPRIRDVVLSLNALDGASTTHSCSGLHEDARPTHVIVAFDTPEDEATHSQIFEGLKSKKTTPPGRRRISRRTYLYEPRKGQTAEEFWNELRVRVNE